MTNKKSVQKAELRLFLIEPTTYLANVNSRPAKFMVLEGTVPPPHISGHALYCIFSAVNTVIGLCLATKSIDLWWNLCAIILYFIVHVRCRRKKFTFAISSPDEFLVYIRHCYC